MRRFIALTIVLTATVWISAQTQPATPGYQLPPKEIIDICAQSEVRIEIADAKMPENTGA